MASPRLTTPQRYYSFGALKLFILNAVANESIATITSRVATSSSFEKGLSFELEKTISLKTSEQ